MAHAKSDKCDRCVWRVCDPRKRVSGEKTERVPCNQRDPVTQITNVTMLLTWPVSLTRPNFVKFTQENTKQIDPKTHDVTNVTHVTPKSNLPNDLTYCLCDPVNMKQNLPTCST